MVNTVQNRSSMHYGHFEENTPVTALMMSPDVPKAPLRQIHLPKVGVNLVRDLQEAHTESSELT